jgi:hypothetical protein
MRLCESPQSPVILHPQCVGSRESAKTRMMVDCLLSKRLKKIGIYFSWRTKFQRLVTRRWRNHQGLEGIFTGLVAGAAPGRSSTKMFFRAGGESGDSLDI